MTLIEFRALHLQLCVYNIVSVFSECGSCNRHVRYAGEANDKAFGDLMICQLIYPATSPLAVHTLSIFPSLDFARLWHRKIAVKIRALPAKLGCTPNREIISTATADEEPGVNH